MGQNQSSVSNDGEYISFSEAVNHSTPEEITRLKRAFNPFAKSGMSKEDFQVCVLGNKEADSILTAQLFQYFSRGSDVITFENLVIALVGICRVQSIQTKISKNLCESRINVRFRPPILTATISDSLISFYDVMSNVTHLSVEEVKELERVFASICDKDRSVITPKQWKKADGDCLPRWFVESLFDVIDENQNGTVNFREYVCGVSTMCRGPYPSRIAFLVRIFDEDKDGRLSNSELHQLYETLSVPVDLRSFLHVPFCDFIDIANWACNEGKVYLDKLVNMAWMMGHVCLGLKPESALDMICLYKMFTNLTESKALNEYNVISKAWIEIFERDAAHNRWPPPIDNSKISVEKPNSVMKASLACITPESACLNPNITVSEYVLVAPVLWNALLRWNDAIQNVDGQFTRRRISQCDESFEVELFPLDIIILRNGRKKTPMGREETITEPWAYAQLSRAVTLDELQKLAKSQLQLEQEDIRLWSVSSPENLHKNSNRIDLARFSSLTVKPSLSDYLLLDDPQCTLHELGFTSGKDIKLLLEVRDRVTGIWPEDSRIAAAGAASIGIVGASRDEWLGVGLVNVGNTCYRNAAVQCLARVRPLTEYLLEDEILGRLQRQCDDFSSEITLVYAELLRELLSKSQSNISPKEFNSIVHNTGIFPNREQHDCHEFLTYLLDNYATALSDRVATDSLINTEAKTSQSKSLSEQATDAWTQFLQENNSIITKLFAGQLRSSLVCSECNTSTSVFEGFTSFSVPIGFEDGIFSAHQVYPNDGSIPTRYGLRLSPEANVRELKNTISPLCKIPADSLAVLRIAEKQSLKFPPSWQCLDAPDDYPISRLTSKYQQDPEKWRTVIVQLPGSAKQDLGQPKKYVVALHRRMQIVKHSYFLGSTTGYNFCVFGTPLVLEYGDNCTGKSIYADAWRQLQRFFNIGSMRPGNRAADPCEKLSSHDQFKLLIVKATSLESCAICQPFEFCNGCELSCNDQRPSLPSECCLAIDLAASPLYLLYEQSLEQDVVDHPSVQQTLERYHEEATLQACIRKFSLPETLDSLIYCETCAKNTRREKVMSIWQLPRYWMVHLKRFSYNRILRCISKCDRPIQFPLTGFDPLALLDPERERPEGSLAKYDCIAMACHSGILESGHFVAYTRNDNGTWTLFNDASLSKIRPDDVKCGSAYVLIYERQKSKIT